jgi:hypothetical protein
MATIDDASRSIVYALLLCCAGHELTIDRSNNNCNRAGGSSCRRYCWTFLRAKELETEKHCALDWPQLGDNKSARGFRGQRRDSHGLDHMRAEPVVMHAEMCAPRGSQPFPSSC